MINKFIIAAGILLAANHATAQIYNPVAVTGFNHDVVAETYPNSLATTDTVLDASVHVMYSQSFATAGGFPGGLPDNGMISDPSNSRQFQLQPYNAMNILNVMRNATGWLNLASPSSYQRMSVLAFSTEGASNISVTLEFTDATSTTYIASHTLPDWFDNNTNLVISGFGRCTRTATVTTVNGTPNNPRFYFVDIVLNCVDRKKQVQALRFSNNTTTGTNAPYPNAVFLAVSGQQDTQTVTSSSSPSSCGVSNGSATVAVSGNTGPYSISWNTTPVQTTATITGLSAGMYTATITDANGCTTEETVTVTELVSPSSITAIANPATICAGNSTQLDVLVTGGTISNITWLPGNMTTQTVTVSPAVTTTYTVIGEDGAGCPFSRQVTVVVNQLPAPPVVPDVQVCQGNSGTLEVQGPQSGYTYNWYASATGGSPVHTGSSFTITSVPGIIVYYVEAVVAGCASSARTQTTLTLLPAAQADAGPDQIVVAGDMVQLNATAGPGTYSWSPGTGLSSTTVLNPNASPATTTTYTLTVTHPQGCVATDEVTVTVIPYCINPMEAFTPNGDGINDHWRVTDGSCTTEARVQVYNRYGNLVYESVNYANDWDGKYKGKPVPDGTYYFVISYRLINGKKVFAKGNVTILR